MKHEWRKKEKAIYLPKTKAEVIEVPEFQFFTIRGEGNPGNESFSRYIETLYSLSYAIRMSHKKGLEPEGFYEYTVYPLEGVWDINEEAKRTFDGTINKDDFVFQLMIRQPDFVTEDYAAQIIEMVRDKKPNELLDEVKFERIKEGKCIQMLHLGSYDDEPGTFEIMENFAQENGLRRRSKVHREIYLSDARKTPADKLKTVLRFNVE
jgi:hypothetical protein